MTEEEMIRLYSNDIPFLIKECKKSSKETLLQKKIKKLAKINEDKEEVMKERNRKKIIKLSEKILSILQNDEVHYRVTEYKNLKDKVWSIIKKMKKNSFWWTEE